MSEQKKKAIKFLNSLRGRYIVSQALTIASREMKKVKQPHREDSNIADMEYLRDNLFPIFKYVELATKRIKSKVG